MSGIAPTPIVWSHPTILAFSSSGNSVGDDYDYDHDDGDEDDYDDNDDDNTA